MVTDIMVLKNALLGTSLEVQWLGLGVFTERAQIQSFVQELRSWEAAWGSQKEKKQEMKGSH